MIRLRASCEEKVWGRAPLPAPFDGDESAKIGEIVFDHPDAADAPLLVKYLFTSERLSVQVHPDDEAAARAGLRSGKDEAWVVIDAEPDAAIATGLRRAVSHEELRAAALGGSIVDMLDWQAVRSGDCFYSPAGTIHAIGAGVSVVEIQQNCDVTYRLYDYGRPRPLHLDEALQVARTKPADCRQQPQTLGPGRVRIAAGATLQVERLDGAGSGLIPASAETPVWLIPLAGHGMIGDAAMEAGGVWLTAQPVQLALPPKARLLIATVRPIETDYWKAG